jgi:hypothetical protein
MKAYGDCWKSPPILDLGNGRRKIADSLFGSRRGGVQPFTISFVGRCKNSSRYRGKQRISLLCFEDKHNYSSISMPK